MTVTPAGATPQPRRHSMRRQLLLTLSLTLGLMWLLLSVVSTWLARDEVQELLDVHLAQSAALLMAQVGHEVEEVPSEHTQALAEHANKVAFQIWHYGKRLLLHSEQAPNSRLSRVEQGFSDTTVDGRAWRVFSLWDGKREYLIQVGETVEGRDHLALEFMESLLGPLTVALPGFALLVWIAVGRALRPTARVTAEIARRDPRFLEPIDAPVPEEIAPLVDRLNVLLARVRSSLEGERRFTADASHELRTPLAALRAQIQVAQGASDDAERSGALNNALAAVDRAGHLVSQLLTLARLDGDAWQGQAEAVDLRALSAAALADAASAAAGRRIALSLEGEETAQVQGHAGLIAILLRNLVDNAIRYSPSDSGVTLGIRPHPEGWLLTVCDEGPGIPPELHAQALRRFSRLEGAGTPGSGLGLSIVERIARLHGGSLTLEPGTAGRGLCVTVVFSSAG